MQPLVNDAIRAPQVHLIDEQGTSLGVVSRDQALMLAYERGFDVIEVGPQASPPVAKLGDYGKYLYSLQKKQQRAKAHQKESQVKEVRLSFKIDEHDFQTKVKRAHEFLADGHKIRVSMLLRGREKAYPQDGIEKLRHFAHAVNGKFESPPKQLGSMLSGIVSK